MKPLVPPDVDLKDFAFLPLDVLRLRDSDLALKASGDEFRAAVMLWCVAWHQAPAASLPDDDQSLAAYAGYGRDLASWKLVRDGALRGFVKCDDGRLYHAVLAEKALDAWEGKLKLRHRKECERIKKAAQRAQIPPTYPSFDQWKDSLAATGSDRWDSPPVSPGTDPGRPEEVPGESLPLKGTGIGDRDREREEQDSPHHSGVEPAEGAQVGVEELARSGVQISPAAALTIALRQRGVMIPSTHPDVIEAAREGVTPEEVVAMHETYPGKSGPYVIAAARRQHAQPAQQVATGPPDRPPPTQSRTAAGMRSLDDVSLDEHGNPTLERLAAGRNPGRLQAIDGPQPGVAAVG